MKVFGARVAPVWFAGVLVSVVALVLSGCGGEPMSAVPPSGSGGPAAAGVACKDGGECKVGDMGPGGGTVFYVADGKQSWGQYLEAAPANWHGEDPTAMWGCPGIDIPGANGTEIGQGMANTNAIIAECGTAGIAARWARYYNGGGKTDWFLPAKDELAQMMLHDDDVGGLDDSWYWASTQSDTLNAWTEGVPGDPIHPVGRDTLNAWTEGHWADHSVIEAFRGWQFPSQLIRVRPVRAFVQASVPGAPGAPVLAGTGAGSVGLSWVAPPDGGMPITGYDVQYSTSAGGVYSDAQGCIGLGAVLACTAGGLKGGVGYYFKVRAESRRGVGEYSPPGGPFVPPFTCAEGGDCKVGDTGPGGGKVFYAVGSPQDWGQYLEVAPAGWHRAGADPLAPWGCAGTDIPGANGTEVGSGAANSSEVVNGCHAGGFAAKLAVDYQGGGMSDWFLPSKEELTQLRRSQVGSGGDFGQLWYWSSSQTDAVNAWALDFRMEGDGEVRDPKGDHSQAVRPVRAFWPASAGRGR